MPAPVLSLVAKKGGVGRTTLAINLAGAFADEGMKVLTVDMESQASLTQFFLGSEAAEQLPLAETAAALFEPAAVPLPERMILQTHCDRIWLLPSSETLGDYEIPRPYQTGTLQFALRDFLNAVRDRFDFILIDTPPSLCNLLSWAAVLASDYVLTPLVAEMFSAQALIGVQRLVERAIQLGNSKLELLGYVINQREARPVLEKVTEETVRQLHGGQVFATVVPRLQSYRDAIPAQKPVSSLEPRGKASKVIKELAQELFGRIGYQPPAKPVPTKITRSTKRKVA